MERLELSEGELKKLLVHMVYLWIKESGLEEENVSFIRASLQDGLNKKLGQYTQTQLS